MSTPSNAPMPTVNLEERSNLRKHTAASTANAIRNRKAIRLNGSMLAMPSFVNRYELLTARTIDCAIFGKREFSGDRIPLYPNPQVAWIPASWPQANLNRLPIQELNGMPFIMPMPRLPRRSS